MFRSALSPGNLLQQTATTGDRLCGVVSGREKKGEMNCGWRRESPGTCQSLIDRLTHVGRMVLPYLIQVTYDRIFVTIVTFM